MNTSSTNLLIRRAIVGDLPAINKLNNFVLISAGITHHDDSHDEDIQDIENVYYQNRGEFLVGFQDNMLIGMGGLLYIDENTAKIKKMRVHPGYQHSGLGSMILARLEAKAGEIGYRKLILRTSYILIPAQNFYAKHGYRLINRSDDGAIINYEKPI